MPDRAISFAHEQILPAWWANALQDMLSTYVSQNFQLSLLNATTIRVPAGANAAAVGLVVGGRYRNAVANVDRAHPGGAAGLYDVWAVAANDSISNSPVPFSDATNYAFDLRITATGVPPTISAGVVDVYRRVGIALWDGAAFTAVSQTVDVVEQQDVGETLAALLGVTTQGGRRSGSSFIAASETRNNAAFGLMPTPDRVPGVVVPANAVLEVDFQALTSCTPNTARAAIFIGANQLKVQANVAGIQPRLQAAVCPASGSFTPLVTAPYGLVATDATSATSSDVTTGQAFGYLGFAGETGRIQLDGVTYAITSPSGSVLPLGGGGCRIFNLAAGTYDVSVQFQTVSGAVLTVKERKLIVRVRSA